MDERENELIAHFAGFVQTFDGAHLFTGPSTYFHHRTIERLRAHALPSEALSDDIFLESLYATLASWGMHRMGRSGARMSEFRDFKKSIVNQIGNIRQLEDKQLHKISAIDIPALVENLWSIISAFNIGVGETKIVIGSKTLHHILPELMPPIDRRYTVRFFFRHTTFNQGDQAVFAEMLPRFHTIASSRASEIARLVGVGSMSTSGTKIIDNAIVGWVLDRLGAPDEDA
jgi:hypothetical protein